jgi:hypothetical protein
VPKRPFDASVHQTDARNATLGTRGPTYSGHGTARVCTAVTPGGLTGHGEVRSLGDHVTSILGSAVDARADTATASITAVGDHQSRSDQPPLKSR